MMPALLIALAIALLAVSAVAAEWRSVAKALDQEADLLRQQLNASRIERYRLKAQLRAMGYTPEQVKRPPRRQRQSDMREATREAGRILGDQAGRALAAHIRQEDTASGQVRTKRL